jgi:hypothetical protein
MHRLSKVVGVKMLAAAAALGAVGWAMTDGEASAQGKSQYHPRLHRALHELRQAHRNLKEAQGNFNGHRAEALRDVDHAIHQVERALRYSRPYGTQRAPGGTGVSVSGTSTGGTSIGSGIVKGGTSIGTGITTGGTGVGSGTPSAKTIGTRSARGVQRGVVVTRQK